MIRSTVLAVLVLLATSGCGALTGRSFDTWAQDRGVTARVKAKLAAMDASTVTRIHVDTYQSMVYLTGGVETLDMKRRAEATVRTVEGVEQVVNNIYVAGEGALVAADTDVSASPRATAVRDGAHPLLQRFKRVARINLDTGTPGWTRYSAYDASGRRLATVYSFTTGELTRTGAAAELTADDPIDHVAIYRQGTGTAQYHLVLWHISSEDSAKLE